jgi:hypothetical protein
MTAELSRPAKRPFVLHLVISCGRGDGPAFLSAEHALNSLRSAANQARRDGCEKSTCTSREWCDGCAAHGAEGCAVGWSRPYVEQGDILVF